MACFQSKSEIVERLLQVSSIDVNCKVPQALCTSNLLKDLFNRTPIFYAARNGDTAIGAYNKNHSNHSVEKLIARGAVLDIPSETGETAVRIDLPTSVHMSSC